MHEDESFPGTDITLTNDATGEVMELSLKATDSASYVGHALLRYPDIPILTTEEVGQFFDGDPRVMQSSMSNEDLSQVTERNFDAILNSLTRADVAQGAAAEAALGASIGLWPFVVAYLRGRISQEQLEKACVKVTGDAGVALASRLGFAAILGPWFAWYLLARGVAGLTKAAQPGPGRGYGDWYGNLVGLLAFDGLGLQSQRRPIELASERGRACANEFVRQGSVGRE